MIKHFFSIQDIEKLSDWIDEAIQLKKNPLQYQTLGQNKTIVLLFFDPSLRTRLSTQKAALNLGMQVLVMNFSKEGWSLEYADGVVMDQGKPEHVREAAKVVSQYCDILAIRAFAKLVNRQIDYSEQVIQSFMEHATVPIINMESATAHPLQALADAITISEHKKVKTPKIVLSWAPHPRALPQAVANSFVKMMQSYPADFVITHPEGFELEENIVKDNFVEYDQNLAFQDADFIYTKNWSSYHEYGAHSEDLSWMITKEKMQLTNNAKFMHCLPVRRNVVAEDAVLDSLNSIVIPQAANRTFAAQLVMQKILANQL